VLEVDHIHPVSKGGTDDSMNLITSCFDCNRGKRAKVITDIAPRPDADVAYMKNLQEAAEIARFVKVKRQRDKQRKFACEVLQESWTTCLTPGLMPTETTLCLWLDKYGPEEIEYAIHRSSPKYLNNGFGWTESGAFNKLLKYVSAIMRNRAEERANEVVQ
jgi:hypothetical protein